MKKLCLSIANTNFCKRNVFGRKPRRPIAPFRKGGNPCKPLAPPTFYKQARQGERVFSTGCVLAVRLPKKSGARRRIAPFRKGDNKKSVSDSKPLQHTLYFSTDYKTCTLTARSFAGFLGSSSVSNETLCPSLNLL